MPISKFTILPAVFGAVSSICLALPALAGDVSINDAYAITSGPSAMSGGIFMEIDNSGAADDQLIAAKTDVSKMTQLHTHIIDSNGVAQMREVDGGFTVPAHGAAILKRGGDHIMLMGLTKPLAQGDIVHLTLSFEHAGEVSIDVPVDLTRKP